MYTSASRRGRAASTAFVAVLALAVTLLIQSVGLTPVQAMGEGLYEVVSQKNIPAASTTGIDPPYAPNSTINERLASKTEVEAECDPGDQAISYEPTSSAMDKPVTGTEFRAWLTARMTAAAGPNPPAPPVLPSQLGDTVKFWTPGSTDLLDQAITADYANRISVDRTVVWNEDGDYNTTPFTTWRPSSTGTWLETGAASATFMNAGTNKGWGRVRLLCRRAGTPKVNLATALFNRQIGRGRVMFPTSGSTTTAEDVRKSTSSFDNGTYSDPAPLPNSDMDSLFPSDGHADMTALLAGQPSTSIQLCNWGSKGNGMGAIPSVADPATDTWRALITVENKGDSAPRTVVVRWNPLMMKDKNGNDLYDSYSFADGATGKRVLGVDQIRCGATTGDEARQVVVRRYTVAGQADRYVEFARDDRWDPVVTAGYDSKAAVSTNTAKAGAVPLAGMPQAMPGSVQVGLGDFTGTGISTLAWAARNGSTGLIDVRYAPVWTVAALQSPEKFVVSPKINIPTNSVGMLAIGDWTHRFGTSDAVDDFGIQDGHGKVQPIPLATSPAIAFNADAPFRFAGSGLNVYMSTGALQAPVRLPVQSLPFVDLTNAHNSVHELVFRMNAPSDAGTAQELRLTWDPAGWLGNKAVGGAIFGCNGRPAYYTHVGAQIYVWFMSPQSGFGVELTGWRQPDLIVSDVLEADHLTCADMSGGGQESLIMHNAGVAGHEYIVKPLTMSLDLNTQVLKVTVGTGYKLSYPEPASALVFLGRLTDNAVADGVGFVIDGRDVYENADAFAQTPNIAFEAPPSVGSISDISVGDLNSDGRPEYLSVNQAHVTVFSGVTTPNNGVLTPLDDTYIVSSYDWAPMLTGSSEVPHRQYGVM